MKDLKYGVKIGFELCYYVDKYKDGSYGLLVCYFMMSKLDYVFGKYRNYFCVIYVVGVLFDLYVDCL